MGMDVSISMCWHDDEMSTQGRRKKVSKMKLYLSGMEVMITSTLTVRCRMCRTLDQ